jgi:PAS domain S-box-containing protein
MTQIPSHVASFERFSESSSIGVVLIGMLGLVGWFLDVEALKSWHPGLAAMKANAAFCFVLLGASLWLLQTRRPGRRSRVAARACALAAVLVAFLTLLEYGLTRDLGLDNLLFIESPTAFGFSPPGRMTIVAAMVILLGGLSLLSLPAKSGRGTKAQQYLAALAGVCALQSVFGYIYGSHEALGRTVASAAIALPAAMAATLFSAGLLCLRPADGPLAVFTSEGLGGKVGRRLLLPALAVPIALQMMTVVLQQRGFLDPESSDVVEAVMTVAAFAVGTWLITRVINRLDAQRLSREADLRVSEAKYRQFIEIANEGVTVLDQTNHLVVVNPRMAEMVGRTVEEMIGQTGAAFLDEGSRTRFARAMASQRLGISETIELDLLHADGHRVHVRGSAAPILDEHGQFQGSISMVQDITPLIHAADELRLSEEEFRQLFDEAPTGYHELDTDGRVARVNQTELAMLGYSAVEMLGRHVWEFVDQEGSSREAVLGKLAGTIPPAEHLERVYRRRDGTRITARIQDRLLRDSDGRITGIRSTLQDITELKRAEDELRASETRFRTMFNEAPMGIAVIDSLTGQIQAVNPMFARIAGRPMEELTHLDWETITHPDDVQNDLDQLARLNAGDISGFQMEKRYLHPDGHAVWISMTIAPLKTDDGAHPRHLCMIEDIATRKQHETERESVIAQLQKALAEVKTLRGFLPICASCKKIRDDTGYWNQIESYISTHSDARFSHGVCPECAQRLYPELQEDDDRTSSPA